MLKRCIRTCGTLPVCIAFLNGPRLNTGRREASCHCEQGGWMAGRDSRQQGGRQMCSQLSGGMAIQQRRIERIQRHHGTAPHFGSDLSEDMSPRRIPPRSSGSRLAACTCSLRALPRSCRPATVPTGCRYGMPLDLWVAGNRRHACGSSMRMGLPWTPQQKLHSAACHFAGAPAASGQSKAPARPTTDNQRIR